jgi:hypothetical protein
VSIFTPISSKVSFTILISKVSPFSTVPATAQVHLSGSFFFVEVLWQSNVSQNSFITRREETIYISSFCISFLSL